MCDFSKLKTKTVNVTQVLLVKHYFQEVKKTAIFLAVESPSSWKRWGPALQ